jgi:hypothetical protein
MTVGDLRAELAQLDANASVMIAVNRNFVHVVGVTATRGTPFAVIRGKGKMVQSKVFSIDEEGILGHLARLGLGDKEIGEVLGRPPKAVAQKRKALGLSES